MTKKIMLINETDDESRVAIVEDNLLQEMLIEHRTIEQSKNNIYKGTVVQIQTSLQAAFVDFGNKKHGFLPSSEINLTLYQRKNANSNSPIQHKLKKGQSMLVQVTREAVDQKGAALTTNISLPGRFMVLMPNSNKGGISKKIEDAEERERLKSFISAIDAEKHAAIIRTAGIGRDLVELKKDYTTLKKTWDEVLKAFKEMKKPGLILEEPDVVTRTLRDYYTEDIEEVWVDNPETFQKSLEFMKQSAPRRQKDLKLFVGDRSLFSSYKIERQVEQLTSRDVKLDSGGSIVIEQTEALVAIDVNSGKSNQEGNIDATALRTNLEAAREIARQLRLRNLGGLIVIDFIDMESEKSRKKVEEELQNAMSRDKAQRKFNPISQFGLLELSRQRLSVGISSTVESVCPVCNGKGRILSLLASTNLILRSIRETAARGNLVQIEGVLPLELANHLLNERRQSITDLELEFGIDIILRGDPEINVFNENQLKPTFMSKHAGARGDAESKKDAQKGEEDKRRSRQKERKKPETEEKTKEREQADEERKISAEVLPDVVPEGPEPIETVDEYPEPMETVDEPAELMETVDEPAELMETVDERPKPRPVVEDAEAGIHPPALFSNVQEIESDELAALTSSFENRLKGKPDNQPPRIIDPKYLWKAQPNAASESVAARSEPVPKQKTGSGTVDTLREDGGREPEALTDLNDGETLREDAGSDPAAAVNSAKTGETEKPPAKKGSTKRRSTRKSTSSRTGGRKPSAETKKKTAAAKNQSDPTVDDPDPESSAKESTQTAEKKKTTGRSRSKKSGTQKTATGKSALTESTDADDKAGSEKNRRSSTQRKSSSTAAAKKKTDKEPAKKSPNTRASASKKPSDTKKTATRSKNKSEAKSD